MSHQYSLATLLPPLSPLPRPGPGLAVRARRVRHAADPALAPAPARAVVRRVQVRVPALVLRVAVRVLLTNQRGTRRSRDQPPPTTAHLAAAQQVLLLAGGGGPASREGERILHSLQ